MVVDELVRQNPQWRGKQLADDTVKRCIEPVLLNELSEDIITGLIGMRRVGKTTLMQRLIDKVDENTVYYSFDIEQVPVVDVLDAYFEEIVNEDAEEAEQTYVFLDEVQKTDQWSDHVKAYHDQYDQIKFVITGSSSAMIRHGSGESLVGRINLHHLTPYLFREYLRAIEVDVPKPNLADTPVPRNAKTIKAKFPAYLETGGFPELIDVDEMRRRDRLKDAVDLTLYRDIVNLFNIGRPGLLEALFRAITSQSGNKVNYNKLGRDLDAQYKTVRKYVDTLTQSFLLTKSKRFEDNTLKTYKKRPKLYAGDHAFCTLEHTEEGLRAEKVAHNHLRVLGDTGYWETQRGEVDIILKQPSTTSAYEVKYQEQPEETKSMEAFRREHPDIDLTMITKDTRGDNTIPLWQLLTHVKP